MLVKRIKVGTQCWTPDDGQRERERDSPKHAEFHSKDKFEKLVHVVGFVITIYHDARSPGHQIPYQIFT